MFGELARTMYIWCIYDIFGRETTKYTCIYGVYIQFWPTLGIFGREITKYTVIYGVYTVFLAGKSPNIRSYTMYIYGSGQP